MTRNDHKMRDGLALARVVTPGFMPVSYQMLDDIVQRIVLGVKPEKIILFGSYAYGAPSPDSDLDLLVVMATEASPADRVIAVSRHLRPRPFPLDIMVRTPEEIEAALRDGDFFIQQILTQGKVLYERD